MNLNQDAFRTLGLDTPNFNTRAGNPAGQSDSTSWWIDRHELSPEQLTTVLAAALGTDTTGSEKHF